MLKKLKSLLWLVGLFFWSGVVFSDDLATRVQSVIGNVSTKTVPGIIVLVDGPTGSTLQLRGFTERRSRTPLLASHTLRAGSIGKTYVAALAMMTAQEGLLNLDETIEKYLSPQVMEQLPVSEGLTVRHLLNHTSGIPDFVTARFYLTWKKTEPPTIEQVFKATKGKSAINAPGAMYAYSNTNFYVLALILEKIYEAPLKTLLEEKLFKPLGLEHTYYNEHRPPGDEIHGYGSEFRRWKDTYEWRENHGPDGGVKMTAADLANWMRALFSPGGKLATIGTLMTEQPFRYAQRKQQGLGVEILESRQGTLVYGHTGGLWGYLSAAFYVPKNDTVLILYINRSDSEVFQSTLSSLLRIVAADAGE